MRAGVGFLAATQVIVGVWALLFPTRFFALPVVGMDTSYNGHLMRDYGAMSLASAVVLTAAAVHGEKWLIRVALIMYLTWAVPHFLVHLTMLGHVGPSTGALLMAALAGAIALPVALLGFALRTRESGSGVTPDRDDG